MAKAFQTVQTESRPAAGDGAQVLAFPGISRESVALAMDVLARMGLSTPAIESETAARPTRLTLFKS